MIIGIPGNLGDGKSATMAKMAQHYQSICSSCTGIINETTIIPIIFQEGQEPFSCECETPKPYKIHANFWLNLPNVHYVTTVEDIEKIYDGFAFLDEFWSWIDSRVSGYSDTNLAVTGILHKSRKRGFNVIYESKLIHMTDRRIRELTDYILRPNKYISIEGNLTKIEQNMLYPVNLEPYIDDTWFLIDLISGDGEQVVEESLFQFPLTDIIGLYDTKEEIENLTKGEKSPGIEKGIKIESAFSKELKKLRPDMEILHSTNSRGFDCILKDNGNSMGFDVVSVQKARKNDKTAKIDIRHKNIKSLLKTAHKSKLKPFYAFFVDGVWKVMDMTDDHIIRSTISCRNSKTLEQILGSE
jgi:hypothetical protein